MVFSVSQDVAGLRLEVAGIPIDAHHTQALLRRYGRGAMALAEHAVHVVPPVAASAARPALGVELVDSLLHLEFSQVDDAHAAAADL